MSDGTFIEAIVQHTKPDFTVVPIGGQNFSDKKLIQVKPDPPVIADMLNLSRLDALVSYLETNIDRLDDKELFLHIMSPVEIFLMSKVSSDEFKQRTTHIKVMHVTNPFRFSEFHDQEGFILALQTKFQETPDRNMLLTLLSNIVTEESITSTDDGYHQSIVVKSGTVKVQQVTVPRLVSLKPYRTFPEIGSQPESKFLLRLKQDANKRPMIALYETDGGDWKLQAVSSIDAFLKDKIKNIAILA